MGTERRYRTIEEPASSSFTVRGSRFIGHIAPVSTVSAAEAEIEDWRTDHPDATHVAAAYRVRADPFREWSTDDGEPSGSAGKPALGVLEGEELENVVAVIVRYYGGTNLGYGGLVGAYSDAVSKAVAAAEITTYKPQTQLRIEVAYPDSGTVRGILESTGSEFEAEYESAVQFTVRLPTSEAEAVQERILSATSGRAEIADK